MRTEETAFLLDLKALMEHAILHEKGGSKLDMRLAIHHAHQAVELSLRKKAELLNLSAFHFPEVIRALKNNNVVIPYERQVDELNRTRTLTQHYGTTPDDNDARRLIFTARDFLIDFWKEVFGISYEDLSVSNLIANPRVKALIEEAEKSAKAGKYSEAVKNSVQATYEVQWWIRGRFRVMPPRATAFQARTLVEELDFIFNVALSSPFAFKLWKLKETTGIVFLPVPGGTPILQVRNEHEFTSVDASFALELATEYALWAEQVYS
jgi:HEPN domain-containing protein